MASRDTTESGDWLGNLCGCGGLRVAGFVPVFYSLSPRPSSPRSRPRQKDWHWHWHWHPQSRLHFSLPPHHNSGTTFSINGSQDSDFSSLHRTLRRLHGDHAFPCDTGRIRALHALHSYLATGVKSVLDWADGNTTYPVTSAACFPSSHWYELDNYSPRHTALPRVRPWTTFNSILYYTLHRHAI